MVSWQMLVGGTVILYALGSILEKKSLFKEHAMEYSATFSFLTALLSLPLLFFINLDVSGWYVGLIYLISLFGSLSFLLIAKGTKHMPISLSSPLFSFGPAFTALLGYFFLNEYLTGNQMLGIILILLGSYVLEIEKKKSFFAELLSPIKTMAHSKYVHYVVFAILLVSVGGIVGRFMLNTDNPLAVNPIAYLIIFHVFTAFNFYVLITIYHDGFKGILHGLRNSGKIISLNAIVFVAARLLLVTAMAMPAAKIALIAGLRRMSTVVSAVLGGKLFHEGHMLQRSIACLIMVAGAILVVV